MNFSHLTVTSYSQKISARSQFYIKKIVTFLSILDLIPEGNADIYISLERKSHQLSNGACYEFLRCVLSEKRAGKENLTFSVQTRKCQLLGPKSMECGFNCYGVNVNIYIPLEREFQQLSKDVLYEFFPFIFSEL